MSSQPPTNADDPAAPLFEATTSAVGGDIDAAGDRLVVWPDRVELHDGKGRMRDRIALEAIDEVQVRKRLTSVVLVVTSTGDGQLVLKGVKPAAAKRFRDTVASLKLAASESADATSATPTAEALRRLDELAAMGLLTDEEVAEKRAVLAQRTVQRRG